MQTSTSHGMGGHSAPVRYAPPAMPGTRVILADDHELVRCGIRTLLEAIDGVSVVAEARDGAELLRCLASTPVDLVLTDMAMPGVDGLRAIAQIRERYPDLPVLVLSMHADGQLVRRAMQSGASGYLCKNASDIELEIAVRSVVTTGAYFSAGVTHCLLQPAQAQAAEELTPRQLEILTGLAQGRSSKQLAFELGLSTRTVDVHRARIMLRLGVGDLASLTRYALRQGLIAA